MSGTDEHPELLIGLVAPVGVNLANVEQILTDYLQQFKYSVNTIHLSKFLRNIGGLETTTFEEPEAKRIDSYMTAGDEARQKAGRGDILAALAIYEINQKREAAAPLAGRAHILRSLKHPDEVHLLRAVYGDGFYLLGIASSRSRKLAYLTEQRGIPRDDAEKLIKRDESEEDEFGQHMRDVFHLADGFIDIDAHDASEQLGRILDLVFGKPCVTPTKDEYAMFLAFAAALRSGDLSRQVGAVLTSMDGEVIATGANDVPCSKGGLYWADHGELDRRDHAMGFDSNERRKNEIVIKVMEQLEKGDLGPEKLLEKGRELLKDTGILEITEYGRAVHAEMEAVLSCARSGVSPRRGTLYCTTFPCHNCAKHIVAAGIRRVVFVEPYPKSLAMDLHSDSLVLAHETEDNEENGKVRFEPFVGIGPRRFVDLFSTTLSRGRRISRKTDGDVAKWDRGSACVRIPLLPISYIDRETHVVNELDQLTGGGNGNKQTE